MRERERDRGKREKQSEKNTEKSEQNEGGMKIDASDFAFK